MLYCFNCRKVCFKPHFIPRKSLANGAGYWTCKKVRS